MGKKVNVLKNKGTSAVFFSICKMKGKTIPSLIAEDLDLTPAGVYSQITRLKKAGIVFKEKTEGRFNYYSIDWKKFVELIIKRYEKDSTLQHLITCGSVPDNKNTTKKQVKDLLDQLKKNKEFNEFIKKFFLEIVKDETKIPESIDEALDDIEEHIMKYSFEEKLTTLQKTFKKWHEYIKPHDFDTYEVFKEVMAE